MTAKPGTSKLLRILAALFTVVTPAVIAQEPGLGGDTLEITSERIDRLLNGLKGEKPLREQIAKSTGAVGQHSGPLTKAEIERIQECGKADMQRYQQQASARQQGMDPKEVEKMNREAEKKAQEQARKSKKRMMELARSGDAAALQAYQDSLARARSQHSLQRQGPECGSLEASATPAQLAQIDAAGAKASGIPLSQYLILRNRVGMYFRTGGAGRTEGAYTKDEKKVFEKRGRDLMPYGMILGTSAH
jgi:hypothetical protein